MPDALRLSGLLGLILTPVIRFQIPELLLLSLDWHRILPVQLAKLNNNAINPKLEELRDMKWEKPSYNDLRFGFEVTMYIYNR